MNEDGLGNGLISGSVRHIDYLFITTVKYLRVREAPLWLNNIDKLSFCHVTSSEPHLQKKTGAHVSNNFFWPVTRIRA